MITIVTPEDREKLELVEKVWDSLSKDELLQLLGQDLVVSKLRGESNRLGLISGLIHDNISKDSEVSLIKSELNTMRSQLFEARADLVTLMKFVNEKFNGYSNAQSEFNSMKNKYGIY